MPAPTDPTVAGLVLAAGGSRRLGAPKQLLPLGGATLLDRTLGVARACGFGQLICVLGPDADAVRAAVDLGGIEVVENPGQAGGCASSIAVGLDALDPRVETLALLLGDQPGVSPATVAALFAHRAATRIAVCRYDDGRGHPLAFSRDMFAELHALHGDRGVWRLLDRHAGEVLEVPVAGPVPRDVDTWDDYAALVAAEGGP
jgi:molybdenum cofactor cytidylyltransferase